MDKPSKDLKLIDPPTEPSAEQGFKGLNPKDQGDLLFAMHPGVDVPENTRVIWVSHFEGYWGRHYFQVTGYPHDGMELCFMPVPQL